MSRLETDSSGLEGTGEDREAGEGQEQMVLEGVIKGRACMYKDIATYEGEKKRVGRYS